MVIGAVKHRGNLPKTAEYKERTEKKRKLHRKNIEVMIGNKKQKCH